MVPTLNQRTEYKSFPTARGMMTVHRSASTHLAFDISKGERAGIAMTLTVTDIHGSREESCFYNTYIKDPDKINTYYLATLDVDNYSKAWLDRGLQKDVTEGARNWYQLRAAIHAWLLEVNQ